MTGMNMRPEEIRSGGRKIGDAGDDLDHVLTTLKSALDAEGECWGGDDAGKKFAQDYTKGRDSVLDGLHKLVEGLSGVDRNLKATADDTEGGDAKSAHDIGNVGRS
ncbi:hypothetical protein GCM10025787_59700 [Saccharopolyspora rosea]